MSRKTYLTVLSLCWLWLGFMVSPVGAQNGDCQVEAGSFASSQMCMANDQVMIAAMHKGDAVIPDGYQTLYVLTQGEELVIQNVSEEASFAVDALGLYTIHTLIYDPTTLDLGIVEAGVTTGVDVNGLLTQGGGDICAALDVAGAKFQFNSCELTCDAAAGSLAAVEGACLNNGVASITATVVEQPSIPEGFQRIYVLTEGEELVIQNVNDSPEFEVAEEGRYTIHTLIYDPNTLDLGVVEIGVTTGFDVNGLLVQGGGDICAALDVPGAAFNLEECPCDATAGTLTAVAGACLKDGTGAIEANIEEEPTIPEGYQRIYVLTQGEGLVIQNVSETPAFEVSEGGRFTIHTLIYDPNTLDLGIVEIGVTTGVDVNGLLVQGGGDICAALDVPGAAFDLEECPCDATAGTLAPVEGICLKNGMAFIEATVNDEPNIPAGFQFIYVLTQGEELVIQNVSETPSFNVTETGRFTIHTLVFDPNTLDLGIVELGVTTGVDVNGLLIQGGGDICAALDVPGAAFNLEECPCDATAGTLTPVDGACLDNGMAMIEATVEGEPNIPEGFQRLYVLTQGTELVIRGISENPLFEVAEPGVFTIHTLIYDPTGLDLSGVQIGTTTGFDVNGLLIQGGGNVCGALDVAGAAFDIEDCTCDASAGTLSPVDGACLKDGMATIEATIGDEPLIPDGFQRIYVLTQGEGLVIQNVSETPAFDVTEGGRFTIHTLIYDPNTLDLGIVEIGVTTGVDVNGLLIQGGGDICAALDVPGAAFDIEDCTCDASAGTLSPVDGACLKDGMATIEATIGDEPLIPDGFQRIYVLTQGEGLVIQNVSETPAFDVTEGGRFTIHTLIYDPNTLDLGIVEIGVTTGVDVNGLLIQGGGDICAALDVPGAAFDIEDCTCDASAGTLSPVDGACLKDGMATIEATIGDEPLIPDGFQRIYVLTQGEGLVIQNVSETPAFDVTEGGRFTIHTLIYDPNTLDLGIVEIGVTTGVDVNGLLIQGGGDICAALDVPGAAFDIEDCTCDASAGTLSPVDGACLKDGMATIEATIGDEPLIPDGFQRIYVLTQGEGLVIQNVSETPAFDVTEGGRFTIHTLIYDPNTLDLGIVEIGVTTGVDVNGLLIQGGGDICAALDVPGAAFDIEDCTCDASAGTLSPVDGACLKDGMATIEATIGDEPLIPDGFQRIYVLTQGEGLVIQNVSETPAFDVTEGGRFTIHTLIYDPNTLDLGIVEIGVTTGVDVNGLLIQGGGDICAALDVPGAAFDIEDCTSCEAVAGSLTPKNDPCLEHGEALLIADEVDAPSIPEGFEVLYVLTSGNGLVIENVNSHPRFKVFEEGLFTIHTLVYDPQTLDLGIVVPGETTGFDVNSLLVQGGGTICAALDVAGASFYIYDCEEGCIAAAGALAAIDQPCLEAGVATLAAERTSATNVPAGYETLYVLTTGDELVITGVNTEPSFEVTTLGSYTIHTLVYDPTTLDLNIVVPGETTGFDVNGLLIQGGGAICASLDVAGAAFDVEFNCEDICDADAGTLLTDSEDCLREGQATLVARHNYRPELPEGFEKIYVLTSGNDLVIQDVNAEPEFVVNSGGRFTIHTLVYDPATLDLSIVVPGETTGFDVNGLLKQGGGDICASLDVVGAPFFLGACNDSCGTGHGRLVLRRQDCLENGEATIEGKFLELPTIPDNSYITTFVLTKGEDLVIVDVNNRARFKVNEPGLYTIHTFVYDSTALDLGVVELGVTTGFDVYGLITPGGGDICAALDVVGLPFVVTECSEGINGLKIGPNPTTESVRLNFYDATDVERVLIEVVDPNGNIVKRIDAAGGNQAVKVDVSDVPPGIFMLRISYDGEERKIRKLIKQ